MRLWPLGLALVIGLAVGALVFGKHGPTKAERAADSTLATVPAWQDSLRVRDSLTAIADTENAAIRRQGRMLGKIAREAKAEAHRLQALVDTMLAPGSASDSVAQLTTIVQGQQRAAVQFNLAVGALTAQHGLDSLALEQADRTIASERRWRTEDQKRVDRLTKNLSDLRGESKNRGKFLGFLPPWTDEVLLVAGGVTLGIAIGKGP